MIFSRISDFKTCLKIKDKRTLIGFRVQEIISSAWPIIYVLRGYDPVAGNLLISLIVLADQQGLEHSEEGLWVG